ncbi:Retrotransposon gag protein [Rhizoctonia solani]|uniref:Retrotransposon gag protein n=1 Tax=Rhizoctonia solani TaxID=456999 RepID=A0A8H7M1V5_9AGAM|nr:Retrotransposon gag protein [Rhizoctonia solani]
MGLEAPTPRALDPRGHKTPAVEATPRPLSKVDPVGLTSRVSFWPKPSKGLPAFAQPTPAQAVPPRVPSPPPSPRLQSRSGQLPLLLRLQSPPIPLQSRSYPSFDEHEGHRWAWAHPHLDQLGSHRAIIQTVKGFKVEFLAAFGDPDATRAAERKITTLTQSGTCADYITKFRTLAMELDWNDAALRGQFARGLHWENAALVIDNALREEHASHPPRDNKPSKQSNPARGTSTGQPTTGSKKLSDDPNFVLEEERNRCRAAGACIKCGKMGHKFAECRTGWKATPIEDKGKAKETAKIGKDSEYQLGKE